MPAITREIVVIGGGPAGLAAACRAREEGVEEVLVLERDLEPGGILPQCIHNGFGLQYFKEELTGPEYAQRFIGRAEELGVELLLNTMVLEIQADRKVFAVNSEQGLLEIQAKAIILAMGCRERTRGALSIPGTRPAGVFTAGTAQRLTNIEGLLPGREVVILGSGDIGLIMARRMHLEGADVKGVVEILPYTGGLTRNVVQCLEDFKIPLLLQHTVTEVCGRERIEAVVVSKVDLQGRPIPGTERKLACDTLLLSVGLIPENELSKEAGIVLDPQTGGPVVNEARETSQSGIFACGNALHVHDLVDYVTEEGIIAGENAAKFVSGNRNFLPVEIEVTAGQNVRYVLPQKISLAGEGRKVIPLFLRAKEPLRGVALRVRAGQEELLGNRREYVRPAEMLRVSLPERYLPLAAEKGHLRVEIVPVGGGQCV